MIFDICSANLIAVLPSGSSIVRPGLVSPLPRDTTPPPTPPSNINTTNIAKLEPALQHPLNRPSSINTTKSTSSLHSTRDRAAGRTTHEGKMVFGHGSNRPGLSQRRRNFANTNALTDQEADLTSKDRATQREAVAKFLAENVKDDWSWEWPKPADVPKTPTSPTLLRSPTSDLSQEITVEWKERDEWSDNASEGAEDSPSSKVASPAKEDAFRFESPDGVGDTIKKIETDRKRRRKKRIADEMAWNDGLHCFIERRDAWTGARRVSRSPRVGMSPIRKHRLSTSLSSKDDGSSTAIEQEEDSEWDDEIEIPIAPPFLPPENSLRASIGPHAYSTIYDKVILNQLTPLCPINLKDVTRSCVKGWQRDGEWPPKPPELPRGSNRRKLSVAGLFGFDKPDSPKDKEPAEGTGVQKDGEKREDSPVSSIGSKLGKILHLKKK